LSQPVVLYDPQRQSAGYPSDLILKCVKCNELLYTRDWIKNLKVCPACQHHMRLTARERIMQLLDTDSFVEDGTEVRPVDPLQFVNQSQAYATKLLEAQQKTHLNDAVVIGHGTLHGSRLVVAVMDFHFIGGSMGSVVGEKIVRAIELACEYNLPFLAVTASGGARIHEGIFSLMQMAKTTVALSQLSAARLPFISLLTDPTTGGVTASFASLGDIILAEPNALIGFAGPRVIEGFMRQKLPADTDTAEFMLAHGMIDAIVERNQLRSTLSLLLRFFSPMQSTSEYSAPGLEAFVTHESATKQETQHTAEDYWQQVLLARHRDRPYTLDYIRTMCKDFFELRGDRRYADDRAVLGGLATLGTQTVLLIGHQKGRNTKEKTACNFGMPHPEGYRKAQRLMRLAEKFAFCVVSLIDTPGAAPDLEAEQRGQSQAIAESLAIMATLRVPIVAVVIGEGGSGGALALGLADRVFMQEHAIYTVAAPEAAASIVWRNSSFAPQAAAAMRITAHDLRELEIIDNIIREPSEGAHTDHRSAAQFVAQAIQLTLAQLSAIPTEELLAARQMKFRKAGRFSLVYPDASSF
jgi:acetyl-CoA carboxylase carboxyl transferase beta subunit/acetyl-CoA carboxylase carboxyl transferase alpha subunit